MNNIYQQQAMETDHAVLSVGNEIEAVATLAAWLSYKSPSNRVEAHKLHQYLCMPCIFFGVTLKLG
jgi:hypothetical protein